MKINRLSCTILLIVFCTIIGCSPIEHTQETPTIIVITKPPISPLPPKPEPTLTMIPPTNTPYINVVSSTLPAIPTLEAGEAISLLQEFLKNDLPCQLPCWGGITPGKSTVTDAQKQLAILMGISDNTFFGQVEDSWIVGTLDIYYPLENTVVNIWPSYVTLSNNETVLNIGIGTQSLPQNPNGLVYGDKEYNAFLSAYTMHQILATYGLPNLIYARADINAAEPTAPDYFIIRLLYLDLGIFIRYTMPMETKENTFRFCPSESLINLELTSQDVGINYQEFFRQVGNEEWASLPFTTHDQPVEEALGLKHEEFSQFIISAPETCFESPIEIWPEP